MYRRIVYPLFGVLVFAVQPSFAQNPTPTLMSPQVAPEIEAKVWLNPQPARLYPKSVYALVAFWSDSRPLPPKILKSVDDLYRRYGDGRLMVVGLSEDKAKRIEQLVRREKVKFQIGAESPSAEKFGLKETPAVVLIDLRAREIRWKGEGEQLNASALREGVSTVLGDPEGHDRSARLAEEEAANRNLISSRGVEAETAVSNVTAQILAETTQQPWVEPEDLATLDDFYDRNLPSDPDHPAAPSENLARMYAMGADGDSGYGGLYKSGRLSDSAKAYVRERLLSMAQDDPDPSNRINAVGTIGRQIGGDAGGMCDEMRAMRDAEPEPAVRGIWNSTIDHVDRSPSPEVQARRNRPTNANKLRRMMHNEAHRNPGRWSDAQAYYETRLQRSTAQLLADYRSFSDTQDEVQRENAVLKRSFAIDTIAERIDDGKTNDDPSLATELFQTLGGESDYAIRSHTVQALASMGKRASPGERQQIISWLKQYLPAESDPYAARPAVEQAIEDLKAIR